MSDEVLDRAYTELRRKVEESLDQKSLESLDMIWRIFAITRSSLGMAAREARELREQARLLSEKETNDAQRIAWLARNPGMLARLQKKIQRRGLGVRSALDQLIEGRGIDDLKPPEGQTNGVTKNGAAAFVPDSSDEHDPKRS